MTLYNADVYMSATIRHWALIGLVWRPV